MSTKLDRFIWDLHPSRMSDPAHRAADEAIATYPEERFRISDWSDYAGCMIRFLGHLDSHIIGLAESMPGSAEFGWSRCIRILRAIYGTPNGEKTAFEIVRTGKGDGLVGLLRKFAHEMAQQYVQNQTRAIISAYWNSLSVDEKLTVPDEYLAKYGHLLPSELTEAGLGRVHAEFPRILEAHARMLNRARGLRLN